MCVVCVVYVCVCVCMCLRLNEAEQGSGDILERARAVKGVVVGSDTP